MTDSDQEATLAMMQEEGDDHPMTSLLSATPPRSRTASACSTDATETLKRGASLMAEIANTTLSPIMMQKKRPYRRTKRPKNYCDKSTVTTTTPTAHTPVNVYDAVLGECDDLLRASLEAQRLGRLKMASAYQLLLHTRLVGLGKRFDRTAIVHTVGSRGGASAAAASASSNNEDAGGDGTAHQSDSMEEAPPPSAAAAAATTGGRPPLAPPAAASAHTDRQQNFPHALQQLISILPSNLEMDTTMMEQLARTAVELHHQRTGRKKSADGLLASPMTGFIGDAPGDNAKVAWSPHEQEIFQQALDEKCAPYAIAKLLPNKTEAQVKAYIKNQKKKLTSSLDEDDHLASPSKKRGGRGRKPPTTAMNTVPNANLDARSLLQGFLKKDDTTTTTGPVI